MAPPRRILRQQLEILLDGLEANKDMAKGLRPGSPVNQQGMRQKWAALGKQLNAVPSGAMKTPQAWKKYWFEWRHKCRKKAATIQKYRMAPDGTNSYLQLNDSELRCLEISGKDYVEAVMPCFNQLDNSLADDSSSEPLENIKTQPTPVRVKVRRFKTTIPKSNRDEDQRGTSPPPKWALDLEERRIAAEERMADALEAIATIMKAQDERRGALDDRIADTLTAIAGTVQDLNSGIQEAVQTLQQTQLRPNNMKEEVFL